MKEKQLTPFEPSPLDTLLTRTGREWVSGDILLDNYRVDRVLGEGGMGKVFLVYSETGDEYLAVKTLLRKALDHSRSKQHFIRELRMWIDLPAHPNITACRFFRTVKNRLAIFSEYIDGGSLSNWIENNKILHLPQVIDVAIQIAWGIDAAHKQGIIHQDIKPANILLTQDAVAKITDFGLARGRQQAVLNNAKGMTPAFCSPEQAENNKISEKTDIWSYGLTVLQMFTGRVTWRFGCLAPEILEAYLTKSSCYPYPEMPAKLALILNKCFRADPQERWASMAEIADELVKLYQDVTGCPYFRSCPEPLKQQKKTIFNESLSWVSSSSWFEKISEMVDLDNKLSGSFLTENTGSIKTRILNELESYEDLITFFVVYIQEDRFDLIVFLSDLLKDKAKLHLLINDYPGAIELYKKSISLQLTLTNKIRDGQGQIRLASTFYLLAAAYKDKRDFNQSVKCSNTVLSIFNDEQYEDEILVIQTERLKTMINLAVCYYYLEDYHQALDYIDIAENVFKSINVDSGNKNLLFYQSQIFRYRSNIYRMLQQNEKSLQALINSLNIFKDVPDDSLEPPAIREKAALYMNLANLHSRMGNHEKSLINHDRSSELKASLIKHYGWEMMAGSIALDYMNKAVSLQALHRNEEALKLLEKAVEIQREIIIYFGQHEKENDLSLVYLNKSVVLYELGRLDESLEFINNAAEIKERLYQSRGKLEMAQQLSMVYVNKAIILQELEQIEEAIRFDDKAIKIRKMLFYKENRREIGIGLANLYSNKASLLFALKKDGEAMKLCDSAIALFGTLTQGGDQRQIRLYIAVTYGVKASGILECNPSSKEGFKANEVGLAMLKEIVLDENCIQYFDYLGDLWITKIRTMVALDDLEGAIIERDNLFRILENFKNKETQKHLKLLESKLKSKLPESLQ